MILYHYPAPGNFQIKMVFIDVHRDHMQAFTHAILISVGIYALFLGNTPEDGTHYIASI